MTDNKTGQKITVTELNADSIPSVIKIGEETDLSKWSAKSYIAEIEKKDSAGLAIFSDEELTGFILIRVLYPDEAEILNFAVKKTQQRKGFGKKLFTAALQQIAESRKIKSLWLEVRESNSTAIRFYEKQGFKIISKRKNFYTQPLEDALLMKLDIRAGSNFILD